MVESQEGLKLRLLYESGVRRVVAVGRISRRVETIVAGFLSRASMVSMCRISRRVET